MSEFLMVVPPDFIEIANPEEWFRQADPFRIMSLVAECDWQELSNILEASGAIAPNTMITDARMIDAGDGARFWYKL